MAKSQIWLSLAISVDGFIADEDGGVDWLAAFDANDFGVAEFMASMDRIVMGRTTYDQARGFGEWPYGGKPVYVLTSRPLEGDVPPGVVAWLAGVPALIEHFDSAGGTVWLMGGGVAAKEFFDAGRVDRLDLNIIPILLGRGIRIFLPREGHRQLALVEAKALAQGLVRLVYSSEI